jgi:SAM-dependent methyltransferase
VICCFQVIEHITDIDSFLKNIFQLLVEGGVFVVSTCNKSDSSPGSDVPLNKFHVKEYFFSEFRDLLKRYFGSMNIVCLKRTAKLNFYRRLKKIGILKGLYSNSGRGSFRIASGNLEKALDFIAVCKK